MQTTTADKKDEKPRSRITLVIVLLKQLKIVCALTTKDAAIINVWDGYDIITSYQYFGFITLSCTGINVMGKELVTHRSKAKAP